MTLGSNNHKSANNHKNGTNHVQIAAALCRPRSLPRRVPDRATAKARSLGGGPRALQVSLLIMARKATSSPHNLQGALSTAVSLLRAAPSPTSASLAPS